MCSLPEDNSDLEQVAVKTQEEDLAGNSDAFISTLGTLSTVHVITNVSSSQCKMLSNRLMQAKCLQWKWNLLDLNNYLVLTWVLECTQERTILCFIYDYFWNLMWPVHNEPNLKIGHFTCTYCHPYLMCLKFVAELPDLPISD